MRIQPDGTLGAVLASEGLGFTETLVNGAGGCRSRTQIVMRDVIPSYSPEGQGCCRSRYFSRQSRLPCTYLNGDDMVFGCEGKVEAAKDSIEEVSGKGTAMVDTLAASLTCSDHSLPVGGGPIMPDCDLSMLTFDGGYDAMTRAILERSDLSGKRERRSVNILGYGLADMGWESGVETLTPLLNAMGIDDVMFVGCRNMDPHGISGAELDVMLHPQRSSSTADYLETRFGIPGLRPSLGAPVGYTATRNLLTEIGEMMDLDPSPAIAMIDKDERRVRDRLLNLNKGVNSLRCRNLCMECESSIAYPLTVWMVGKFGLIPRSIKVTDKEYLPELNDYLENLGFPEAMDGAMPDDPDIVFTDGIEADLGRKTDGASSYIEMRLPFIRSIDLLDRTIIGPRGCRYLLDSLLNNASRFRCGQPSNADMR